MDIKLQSILNDIVNDVLQEESGGTSTLGNDIIQNELAKSGGVYDQWDASQKNINDLQDKLYDMGQNPQKYTPEEVAAAKEAYQKALDPHYALQDKVERMQNGNYTAADVARGVPSYLAHKARVVYQDHPVATGVTAGALGTALAAGAGALALRKQRRAAGQQ